ncbi:MAG: IS30 family transposase [Prevotella sp.]|nr:IS30 family transposase [Prevotella sp.]
MRQKKFTISFIAGTIGVSVSTVCRELKRNSDSKGGDDGQRAVLKTMRRRAKSPGNRSIPPRCAAGGFELIRKQQWSPEQVSGWLKREEGLAVSKYAIYNWIAGSSPHYKDCIHKHLRHGGKRCRNSAQGPRIPITNRVSIDERPAEANGQTLGDWEMDTIVGKDGKGAIVTLVERKSACMLMEKLDTGRPYRWQMQW